MLRRKELKADLCIVGGGLAGICASIAASRNGAKVVLMQERPMLGGNSSSEIRMWVCGANGPNNRATGILEEIALENFYRNPTKNPYLWDSVLYDFVLREPNITLLLNCTCMDADTQTGTYKDGRDIRITKVTGYQMTTQTFFDVFAEYYADCSGDSILAPLTGAAYRTGREGKDEYGEPTHVEKHDDLTMGMSCPLQGRETEKKIPFIAPSWSTPLTKEDFEDRYLDIHNRSENYWYLELGGDRDSIHDTEEINKDLLALAMGTWDYIKNSGDQEADTWELEYLGFLPGKRESRRMTGEYTITGNDILEGTEFDDTVAFGGWNIDDHYPGGFFHKGSPNFTAKAKCPYSIPYRCLYSKNVDNLFFAGRNVSMTHMAMSSIRVMETCALLGQAVGTAAAIALKWQLTPHEVYKEKLEILQKILMEQDCMLPGKRRSVSELCKRTEFTGGCNGMRNGEDRPHFLYNSEICGGSVRNGEALEYLFEKSEYIDAIHITFNSDLNRETLQGTSIQRRLASRCNVFLDAPQVYVPKTLCKEFQVEVETEQGTKCVLDVQNNRKRAYHLFVKEEVTAIRLIPRANWGESEETDVFSFDFC